MPLYEYQCDSCGARVERIQKYSDPPLKDCPTCSGSLTKLISSPAIQFKGSGWYITDYARKSEGEKGTTDSKDSRDAKEKDSKDTKESTQKGDGAAAPAASSSSSEPTSGNKAAAAAAPGKNTKD